MLKEYCEKINKSSILCFDFDGTIACSNLVKIKAFEDASLMISSQIQREDFMKVVKSNFGIMNRYEMCSTFLKNSKHSNENFLQEMCKRYALSLKKAYFKSKFVPGFQNFLTKNKEKMIIIVTSGNKEEICGFLEKNNILHHFDKILDNKKKKHEHYKNILDIANNSRVGVFGDSLEDYESSSILNRDFFFIEYESHVLNDIHKNKIKLLVDKRVSILKDYR